MIKTMNEFYGDGSDHEVCLKCGFCSECKDCYKFGCGKEFNGALDSPKKVKVKHQGALNNAKTCRY